MDPFITLPLRRYRVPNEGMKRFHKQEVIYFVESMSFEFIQIPIEMTTSADQDLTVAFIQAFCDALADSLVKASPPKSSPEKLVERIKSPQMDTLMKIPTKPDQPKLVESRNLEEKLALFPSLYGANPTGRKTSMAPFA